MSKVRVHSADPDFRAGDCILKFTLTYEGELRTGSGRGSDGRTSADRKQGLREHYHRQLKLLWNVNHFLRGWVKHSDSYANESMEDYARKNSPKLGATEFIPLVTKSAYVDCWIDFRILRPSHDLGNAPDIDNQIKVLFDGLKMPRVLDEMGKLKSAPSSPLYVLLEDDGLVSKITSTQDELLQPVLRKDDISNNDVRVIIDVHIRPQIPTPENVIFYSDEASQWNHGYYDDMPGNLPRLSDPELKAVATQCIFRIKALAEVFNQWNRNERDRHIITRNDSEEDWERKRQENSMKSRKNSDLQSDIWKLNLWPKSLAIKEELNRRIFGEPPYPKDIRSHVIDRGSLAGSQALENAVSDLESLVRRIG